VKATAPHYDFEKNLTARQTLAPVRIEVGATVNNPDYKPEPLPLTERIPWLIYVVLGASSLALAMILISLARTTLRTEPPQAEESTESGSSPTVREGVLSAPTPCKGIDRLLYVGYCPDLPE